MLVDPRRISARRMDHPKDRVCPNEIPRIHGRATIRRITLEPARVDGGKAAVGDSRTGRATVELGWVAQEGLASESPLEKRYKRAGVTRQTWQRRHGATVCVNDRVQVFRTDGTFVREAVFDPETFRSGSVWDMTFSRDPQQTYIYMANGVNETIHVVLRSTLEVLTSFGDGGRQPGQFFGVHNMDTDSNGKLYTAETYTGARVQRFIFKGVGPVTKRDQGVPWPAGR